MMYTKKPNHMGVEIGRVISYNPNKGHVKIKLSKELNLGDSISINDSSCKISELMDKNTNIKIANSGKIVTIGRIKGKIYKDDIVYRTVSEKLNKDIIQLSSKENIKRKANANIYLKENENLKIELEDLITGIKIKRTEDILVSKAENTGLSKERIISQLSKTGNTPFEFDRINVYMDNNIIVPISSLNSIRRNVLEELEAEITNSFKRNSNIKLNMNDQLNISNRLSNYCNTSNINVSILLNTLKDEINYCNLKNVDNIYIPFKLFIEKKEKVQEICNSFNTYVYMPAVTKGNYERLIDNNFDNILNINIKGIVVSNISHFELLRKYKEKIDKIDKLDIISNYTLNIANNNTINELKKLGVSKYIVSPEADKEEIQELGNEISKELIVYGRTLLMTTEYCVIGTVNNCNGLCKNNAYKLKDRMGFEFPIYTDRVICNNLIYNSKIASISWKNLNVNSIRIDILNETEEEIQNIIDIHKKGGRLEGENYTNGNLNREI